MAPRKQKDTGRGHPKLPRISGALIAPAQAAEVLGQHDKVIVSLVGRGLLHKNEDGKVELGAAVQAYCDFLRRDALRNRRSEAAARIQDLKAHDLRLKIAEREGRLVDIVEVEDMMVSAFGGMRAALAGLANRVTKDMALRKQIEAEVDAALTHFADDLKDEAERLKSQSTSVVSTDEDADATAAAELL